MAHNALPPGERQLNLTGLAPPEPLERVLDALTDLSSDQRLRVRLDREPTPLYPMLSGMGYRWRALTVAQGGFELLIWPETLEDPPA
jgi:hypothetical protein